jgi:hypothetical protein
MNDTPFKIVLTSAWLRKVRLTEKIEVQFGESELPLFYGGKS